MSWRAHCYNSAYIASIRAFKLTWLLQAHLTFPRGKSTFWPDIGRTNKIWGSNDPFQLWLTKIFPSLHILFFSSLQIPGEFKYALYQYFYTWLLPELSSVPFVSIMVKGEQVNVRVTISFVELKLCFSIRDNQSSGSWHVCLVYAIL